jgi:hypothetical protein
MAMTFDVSESVAVWLGNSAKYIAQAFATEGIGLPAAIAYSAKEYYSDVRNVTPPANGGTVASLALSRGKAAITLDLHKAFRVVQKVSGVKVNAPLNWYLNQRNSNGRFAGKVRVNVTLSQFRDIEKELHSRVGYMQSGWNQVLQRFNAKIPGWVKNKNGPGGYIIRKTIDRMIVKAENKVKSVSSVNDMQRRIDYVSKKTKQKLEEQSKKIGEKQLKQIFA